MRIKHINDGETIELKSGERNLIVCCICGQTHWFKFKVLNSRRVAVTLGQDHAETKKEIRKALKRLRQEGLPEKKTLAKTSGAH